MVRSHHPGSDRYSEAIPELGLAYLAEVEWTNYRPGRMHSHPEHQFLFVLKGTMVVETAERRYEEGRGALFVLPAKMAHSVNAPEDQPRLHFIDLRLQAEPPVTLAQFLVAMNETRLYLPEKSAQHLALELRRALASSGQTRITRLHAALWDALNGVRTEHDPGTVTDGSLIHLQAAERAMRENLAQPMAVQELAGVAGLSRSQLTRLFMKQSGVGPAERLRQLRVERACELLRNSTQSIKEIAHECGFVCPNHFCRVFGKTMRTTPTEYRAGFAGG